MRLPHVIRKRHTKKRRKAQKRNRASEVYIPMLLKTGEDTFIHYDMTAAEYLSRFGM